MNSDFEFVGDLLPATAIPLACLRIVSYLDEDGAQKYRFMWGGEGSATDVIGILEIIKSEMVHEASKLGGHS